MSFKLLISIIFSFFVVSNLLSQIDSNREIGSDTFNYQPQEEEENKISFEPKIAVINKGEFITSFGTLEEIAENLPKYSVVEKDKRQGMSNYRKKDRDVLVKKYWNGQDVSINKITTKLELGRIDTNTKKIRIECRDHSYVDGDRVRLFVNDVVIRSNIVLQGGYYVIDIDLNEGFNRVDIKALNQGTSGPNTAEFNVFDEHGNLLATKEWNILTGYVATLVVMKN